MIVGRLQKCEQKTNNQELLLHGPMLCAEGINFLERSGNASNKPRELQVFLFEQIIIFADIVGKKTTFVNPSYIYKNHIQVTFFSYNIKFNRKLAIRNKQIFFIGKQNANGRIDGKSYTITVN